MSNTRSIMNHTDLSRSSRSPTPRAFPQEIAPGHEREHDLSQFSPVFDPDGRTPESYALDDPIVKQEFEESSAEHHPHSLGYSYPAHLPPSSFHTTVGMYPTPPNPSIYYPPSEHFLVPGTPRSHYQQSLPTVQNVYQHLTPQQAAVMHLAHLPLVGSVPHFVPGSGNRDDGRLEGFALTDATVLPALTGQRDLPQKTYGIARSERDFLRQRAQTSRRPLAPAMQHQSGTEHSLMHTHVPRFGRRVEKIYGIAKNELQRRWE